MKDLPYKMSIRMYHITEYVLGFRNQRLSCYFSDYLITFLITRLIVFIRIFLLETYVSEVSFIDMFHWREKNNKHA